MEQTLILAPSWEPITACSWRRAVCLRFLAKAEVVESYADKEVRSVTLVMPMPAVIRFLRGTFRGRRSVRFSRENLYAREQGRCAYCGRAITRAETTYDHIVPRAQGGETSWQNVVVCCLACNKRKGARRPEEAGMVLRAKAIRPRTPPEVFRVTVPYRPGMPIEWKQFLTDWGYWEGKLEGV